MHRFLLAAIATAACLLGVVPASAVEAVQVWHQGREIAVVERDGWAVYDGDIVLGRMADVLRRSAGEAPNGATIGGIAKSVTLGGLAAHWPRNASGIYEVAYVVEADPDGNVPSAVQLFNQQLAGFMQAVPRGSQGDYVAFTLSASDDSFACASNVGRIGGRQTIQGSHFCARGLLLHEMGHAVGLWHEQEHDDRDRFVTLDLNAIEPVRVFNFAQTPGQRSATPYDYASIMHYEATSFSRTGLATMETVPPGIGIGQREGFSAGDIEAIRRLYGAPPQEVTVTSLPVGLRVLVDGVAVITPTAFSWALGSTHTIDVPAGVQFGFGAANVFGRWNIDRDGDLAARRTITVTPGDGTLTAPTNAPAISTYTASFVRYRQVRFTTAGNRPGVTGSVTATPAPIALQGVAGTYYRDRQPFSLLAVPDGTAAFGLWDGNYYYAVPRTTGHRNPFRGPALILDSSLAASEYRATFFDVPLVTVRAVAQDGEALGLQATIAPADSAASIERLPYNTTSWGPGQAGSITAGTAPVSPILGSMRYTFRDWDGDPRPTQAVVAPLVGEAPKVLTANYNKEYQAFSQVIPSCAASIGLGGNASGWYAAGSVLPVTLTPASGWIFLGWEGSLSGTSLSASLPVNDYPNLIARFNVVGSRLAVTRVSPSIANVTGDTAITIDGTGFTDASEVYVNGLRQPSVFASASRLTATVSPSALTAVGIALVTVSNRVGTGSCTVNATGELDVLPATGAVVVPQTGWWWNADESGRGFFIEKHGGNLFMAGFLYEADGRATWFSASGAMTGSTFSADMTMFRGGQTLTGPYVAPALGPSPGRIELNFTASDRATLTWPGPPVALTRFAFGSGGANTGENGWWWNSAEYGRGFAIETQGNSLFMAGFMYDSAGNPMWYSAQGTVSGGSFNGSWTQYANGQTLASAYRAPVVVNPNVGPLSMTFSSGRTANLTLPDGRVMTLSRFDF